MARHRQDIGVSSTGWMPGIIGVALPWRRYNSKLSRQIRGNMASIGRYVNTSWCLVVEGLPSIAVAACIINDEMLLVSTLVFEVIFSRFNFIRIDRTYVLYVLTYVWSQKNRFIKLTLLIETPANPIIISFTLQSHIDVS